MRSPNTIIPTVYRVGGTQMLTPTFAKPDVSGVAVSTNPEPEKADASVHAETTVAFVKADMVDAGVHAASQAQTSEASVFASESTLEYEEGPADLPLFPTPPPHSPVLAASVESIADPQPEMTQVIKDAPQVKVSSEVPSLFSTFVTRFAQRGSNEEILRATFVADLNSEDGQVFPAGTEFVKTWFIRNDGQTEWPESTKLTFIAGDRMSSFIGAPMAYPVGNVQPGQIEEISVLHLRAPELPGKYIGFWRLTDGTKPFGQSVWCE